MHKFCLFLYAIILFLSVFAYLPIINVNASEITSTFYVDIGENDGYAIGYDSSYEIAWNTPFNAWDYTTELPFGQIYTSNLGKYCIYRVFLKFDTSIIPSDSVIENATLGLNVVTLSKLYENFYINIQKWIGDTPITTTDYMQFDGINYDDGNYYTTACIANEYSNITISNFELIEKAGNTKICVRSSREINQDVPTQPEHLSVFSYEQGSGYIPFLQVTYTFIPPPETPISILFIALIFFGGIILFVIIVAIKKSNA